MTVSRDTKQGRHRTLGADTEKVILTLPRDMYDALQALAAEEYEAVGTLARRLILHGLREKGKL